MSAPIRAAVTLVGGPAPSIGPTGPDGPVAELLATYGGKMVETRVLSPDYAFDVLCDLPEAALAPLTLALRKVATRWDVCVQPAEGRRKRLLCADMDSTIVQHETIDEMAALIGAGARVADITERAMRGELDFSAALAERVALVKGLPAEKVRELAAGFTLTPGAQALIATMRANGARTVLVSGGFTLATEVITRRVGFDRHVSNTLEVAAPEHFQERREPVFRPEMRSNQELLTGRTTGEIVDGTVKARIQAEETAALGLTPSETLAVGDGANDSLMIAAAGLGAAYRAKPRLKDVADVWIDHGDLTTLLYFQGYSDAEITRPAAA